MSEIERAAHWMLNWVKQHPEIRHQHWLAQKMIREAVEAFPEVQPVELQLALSRAIELRRAELRNQ
ncbi:hypothetical protein [Rhizobium ruizarguesonis]|uniref:Uncharacterized protein n=1 Tax=Rhizobium ruizarguesonis TaxID=2081791 RepID=A0AAE8U1P7_9HYPH|nr:hypothetical protein [Rhizobium ruizarguesonis]TBE49316.1 hypothetical protein ELH06_09155 [Rhizobium ruizarguesonis]TBF18459.1 hypothetical protein ELG94_08840 [Rhizobium ruizarguesonis]WSH22777.1 hypothetical protein U8Q07_10815 [Rhizobium ruizarguesonis]